MQCYQTLGATIRVSRIITSLQGREYLRPQSELADWLESSGIAIEDVLDADYETLKSQIAGFLGREMRAQIKLAA